MGRLYDKMYLKGYAHDPFLALSVPAKKHTETSFCGIDNAELVADWGFTETAFLALIGRKPTSDELFEFSMLLGLIITNGPGTISAQGAKGK